ncbi:hypothetical protein BDV28DRAFT_139470 [Aspergillus coremiiformis]|uniref:Secreted protein n=1 Tax=Aspergillus coremiiformis TaxID=138285 RepID=A0A5N6YZ79_9EURO|nr:hypothetical protein BDV28DRAFT_139470 [Aspergillus coremiiformis]
MPVESHHHVRPFLCILVVSVVVQVATAAESMPFVQGRCPTMVTIVRTVQMVLWYGILRIPYPIPISIKLAYRGVQKDYPHEPP